MSILLPANVLRTHIPKFGRIYSCKNVFLTKNGQTSLLQCGTSFSTWRQPSNLHEIQKCRSFSENSQTFIAHRCYSIYEPDYINVRPEISEYDSLNFKFRGYDFVHLESYAKYVHNLFQSMDLDCISFPVPAKTAEVKSFKPQSTNVKNLYNLAKCERVVQVQGLPNTALPIYLDIIHQNLPEGVELIVKEPDEEEDEDRYVPDMVLLELKNQMGELEKAKEDRKRK